MIDVQKYLGPFGFHYQFYGHWNQSVFWRLTLIAQNLHFAIGVLKMRGKKYEQLQQENETVS